jgi:hypothetical protein
LGAELEARWPRWSPLPPPPADRIVSIEEDAMLEQGDFPAVPPASPGGNIMTTARLLGATLLGSASLIATAGYAEHVRNGGTDVTATLTGAAERPGPGDTDGSGTITITVNPGQKRICYDLTIANIATPTAAHIHIAPVTSPGPIVIPFPAPPLGASSGCINVTSRQAAQLIAKPSAYYFNVHNAAFGPGAIRGQLSKASH